MFRYLMASIAGLPKLGASNTTCRSRRFSRSRFLLNVSFKVKVWAHRLTRILVPWAREVESDWVF